LLGVLIGGILVFLHVSPLPILTSVSRIVLPLGVLLGLVLILVQSRYVTRIDLNLELIAKNGWMGVFVSGFVGAWLVAQTVARGASIIPVCDEVLTVISLGMGAGVIIGGFPAIVNLGTPDPETNQRPVLAESTWTHRSGPDPILVEVVEQIADLDGVEPCELEPLGAYIDPDVFSRLQARGGSTWQVLFHTDRYEVRVNSHGTVSVYDVDWAETAAEATTAGELP
jgi:hypothetical protein